MIHPLRIHLDEERPLLGGLGRTLSIAGFGAGLLLFIIGAVLGMAGGPVVFWSSYLTGFIYCLTLTLGALIFVIIQHVTRASWSVVVRRLAELYASNFILLLLLALPLLFFGAPYLYIWINPPTG